MRDSLECLVSFFGYAYYSTASIAYAREFLLIPRRYFFLFSPRALRGEDDRKMDRMHQPRLHLFQSTPPIRRATALYSASFLVCAVFQSTPPIRKATRSAYWRGFLFFGCSCMDIDYLAFSHCLLGLGLFQPVFVPLHGFPGDNSSATSILASSSSIAATFAANSWF